MEIKEQICSAYRRRTNGCFLFASLIMFLICCFATMGGDDIGSMRVNDGTVIDCWEKAISFYETWSSRVLINFVIFVLTRNTHIFWAAYMGCSLFIMQKAFALLFLDSDRDKEQYNILISALVLTCSINKMSSAGWIATSCTYFGPIAFGFMSLVPIKKALKKEKIKWWEYSAYIICLLYGANNEQMMLVILGAYLVMLIYGLLNKYYSSFLLTMTLTSMASLIFILTCPGNHNRAEAELVFHNPTYSMLNFLNKCDLGIATTERYLLFENRIIILVCIMFSVLVFEKYKGLAYRVISCVPVVAVALLGILKDFVIKVYPSLEVITREIPHNGLVNTQNAGGGYAICQYFVMGIAVMMFCIEIFLLQDKLEGIIINFTLLATGFASSIAMGFTPTIFVSGNRVYAVMEYCIIAVSLFTTVNCTSNMKDAGYFSVLLGDKARLFYGSIIAVSLIDLWCFVMTKFV